MGRSSAVRGKGVRTLVIAALFGAALAAVAPQQPAYAANVRLRALEVNQVTQDWHNSVPVVAGKPTAVRAFVEVPDGMTAQTFVGVLAGTSNGNPLPGSPLSALNPDGAVTAAPNIVARRIALADSLNFELPPAWLAAGTVTLTLQSATPFDCLEPAGAPPSSGPANDCAVTVTFVTQPVANIKFIKIPYTANGVLHTPTDEMVVEQMERARSAFPTPNVNFSIDSIEAFDAVPTDFNEIFRRLAAKRTKDFAECGAACPPASTRYYGLIEGAVPEVEGQEAIAGMGYAPGVTGWSWIGTAPARESAGSDDRNTGVHELGHNYGEQHPVDPALGMNENNELLGQCNSVSPQGTPPWPYLETVVIDADNNTALRPLLGPLSSGADSEAWGLDNRYLKDNTNNLAVVDPRKSYELMSYCNSWFPPQGNWPSKQTVISLLDKFNTDPESGTADSPGALVKQGAGDYLAVRGEIDLAANTATLGPLARIVGTPEQPTTGSYRVSLRGAGETELAGADFAPATAHGDPRNEGGASSRAGEFVVAVPKPVSPVLRAVVLHSGTEIGSVSASANGPTVNVTAPAGGSTQSGPTVTISWTASDPDGAGLVFDVSYSPDNGASWETLAVGESDTSLTLDRDELKASNNALVRVEASDGVHVASATSSPFAVANNAPLVVIDNPVDDDAFSEDEQIVLDASAVDTEDGNPPDASYAWSSDRDGALGTGAELTVDADGLTIGQHLITVTVTDVNGATDTDTVRIIIGDLVQPLTPARILDTRPGLPPTDDGYNDGVGPNTTIDVQVTGKGGVPTEGVAAVVLNVTASAPTATGHLTVFPTGEPRPLASNLNFVPGQDVPNAVIAKVGTGGKVSVFNPLGTTQVIFDVAGWIPSGSPYVPLTPARILDTRPGLPPTDEGFNDGVGPNTTIDVQVTGEGGVPTEGVGAVVLNVTVSAPTATGHLTVFPTGEPRPLASSLNFVPGQDVPNLVVAKVGTGGKVSVFNPLGTTQVIFDVAGWIPSGSPYVPLTPARILDTRPGLPPTDEGFNDAIGANQTIDVTVTGVGGVPESAGVVVLNVTVSQPSQQGFLTVFPTGDPRPLASNLNFVPGQDVPNAVIAKVGDDGKVSVFNPLGTTHVIFDVAGWMP